MPSVAKSHIMLSFFRLCQKTFGSENPNLFLVVRIFGLSVVEHQFRHKLSGDKTTKIPKDLELLGILNGSLPKKSYEIQN